MGDFLRRLFAPSEGEIAALTTTMRQLGVGSQGGAEALAIFHQLLHDELADRAACQSHLPEPKSTKKKLLRNDRVEGSARSSVPFSSQAHCSGGVETSELVPR